MAKLLQNGQQMFERMGIPPARPEIVAGQWQQNHWSCGWDLLQTMRCIVDKVNPLGVGRPLPPLDHSSFAEFFNTISVAMGCKATVIDVSGWAPIV
jgi:hypothetical protein